MRSFSAEAQQPARATGRAALQPPGATAAPVIALASARRTSHRRAGATVR